ncbi:hypothetical protein LCGC14_1564390 [marine sediment metagenome]|uniref:Uncharacterized protein n=1 Tax=marine sediment metagenome TaxID=412755 RepID=A0A0F9ILH4_9ZZZZ
MTVYHGDGGDLVKRLRVGADFTYNEDMKEAADCIEAQQAEIERLTRIINEARIAVNDEWPKHPTDEDLYGFYMMVRNAVAAYDEATK